MSHSLRNSIFLSIILSGLFVGKTACAQMYHSDVTFKDSLIRLLFQYGREVYSRGVDPQEASYVFQRILTLDCAHDGAQDFLGKIHDKYPTVSIRIKSCAEESISTDADVTPEKVISPNEDIPLLRKERISNSNSFGLEDVDVIDSADQDNTEVLERSTPLFAYSKPISMDPIPSKVFQPMTETSIASSIKGSRPAFNSKPVTVIHSNHNIYTKSLAEDCEQLRVLNNQFHEEITALEGQIKAKDAIINDIQNLLSQYQDRDSASYAAIATDQRDLIRIQQGNIDYLQKELDDVKEQMLYTEDGAEPAIMAMHNEIANAQLLAKEKEMHLEVKNREAQLLQKQLGEMREQLQLVKRILSEKNDIINSLRDELESIKAESGK